MVKTKNYNQKINENQKGNAKIKNKLKFNIQMWPSRITFL